MKINKLKDANLSLVELRDDGDIGRKTPHCKIHGAMLKLTENGIWRCMTTYLYTGWGTNHCKFKQNNCLAGCQESEI